jgi:hypothetical protein
MEPPAKPLDYLPTIAAKWTLWGSIALAMLLYALPHSLLIDMRLSEETLLWFLRLLLSATVLLVGAYATLFLVIKHFRENGVLINIGLSNIPDLGDRLQRANDRSKEQ